MEHRTLPSIVDFLRYTGVDIHNHCFNSCIVSERVEQDCEIMRKIILNSQSLDICEIIDEFENEAFDIWINDLYRYELEEIRCKKDLENFTSEKYEEFLESEIAKPHYSIELIFYNLSRINKFFIIDPDSFPLLEEYPVKDIYLNYPMNPLFIIENEDDFIFDVGGRIHYYPYLKNQYNVKKIK